MILLLGGTSESLAVADCLVKNRLSFIVSVVSDYGVELASAHAKRVVKVTFTEANFTQFCLAHQVNFIIDATHPFARVISQLAINEAAKLGIPYLRFERQNIYRADASLKMVDSLEEACRYLKHLEGVIYLSTGSKTAPDYAARLGVKQLHIRALPTTRVMKKLTSAGFVAAQIDAIQGPFSTDLNVALFKHATAKVVVTKESGRQGGIQEKIAACQQLGIPCVIIRRPHLNYPQKVEKIDELQAYLEEHNEW